MESHDHAGCIAHAIEHAEKVAAQNGLRFTPVRRRTLEILLESHSAYRAYDLLRRLDEEGFGAQPPVAYRALDFLVEHGFAHKIERLNAFVACMRPNEGHDPAFIICRECKTVAETEATLPKATQTAGFQIESTTVEIEGLCPKCQAGATS